MKIVKDMTMFDSIPETVFKKIYIYNQLQEILRFTTASLLNVRYLTIQY